MIGRLDVKDLLNYTDFTINKKNKEIAINVLGSLLQRPNYKRISNPSIQRITVISKILSSGLLERGYIDYTSTSELSKELGISTTTINNTIAVLSIRTKRDFFTQIPDSGNEYFTRHYKVDQIVNKHGHYVSNVSWSLVVTRKFYDTMKTLGVVFDSNIKQLSDREILKLNRKFEKNAYIKKSKEESVIVEIGTNTTSLTVDGKGNYIDSKEEFIIDKEVRDIVDNN